MDNKPFQTLGMQLRIMRERQQESLAEVSGAVEINIADLERIESGDDRPSEEILALLISHFDMQDIEAHQLWNLAGYDRVDFGQDFARSGEAGLKQQSAVMILAVDVRTMYSDSVKINATSNGLVMEFMQESSSGKGNMPVSRVGMSLEQAQKVVEDLQKSIIRARYGNNLKSLPEPNEPNSKA